MDQKGKLLQFAQSVCSSDAVQRYLREKAIPCDKVIETEEFIWWISRMEPIPDGFFEEKTDTIPTINYSLECKRTGSGLLDESAVFFSYALLIEETGKTRENVYFAHWLRNEVWERIVGTVPALDAKLKAIEIF